MAVLRVCPSVEAKIVPIERAEDAVKSVDCADLFDDTLEEELQQWQSLALEAWELFPYD